MGTKDKGGWVLQDSAKLLTLEQRQKEKLRQSDFRIHVAASVTGVCGRGWRVGCLLSLELSSQMMT